MNVRIEESWRRCLQPEFDSPYFAELAEFVRHEYASCTVYPPARRIFHAFDSCPFDRVRAVIIGQDPYHEPGQYYGLCFSVLDGVPFPPSLVNIFREIESDLGKPFPSSGRLERSGCSADQRDSDRAGSSGRIAPRPRLGKVHRCCDPGTERA